MPASKLFAIRILALALGSALGFGSSQAQSANPQMLASDPHEALSFFEGSWTTSEAKTEDDFRETCSWFAEGRRHMVCRSRWLTTTGAREGLSIFSYDPATREYLYHGFRSSGAVVTQRGTRTARGWIFGSERGEGADRRRARVTIERNPDGGFDLLSETASADGPWKAGASIVYRRLR